MKTLWRLHEDHVEVQFDGSRSVTVPPAASQLLMDAAPTQQSALAVRGAPA